MKLIRQKSQLRANQDNQKLIMIILPMVKIIVFSIIPFVGIVMAFQDYKVTTMFASKWVGFDNFKFIFTSPDLFRLLRNAVVINFLGIVCGLFFGVMIALFIFEVKRKIVRETFQTAMFFPYFIAWPTVGVLLTTIIGANGVFTVFLKSMGADIDFYRSPQYWPFIITIMNVWKTAGFTSIGYYAVLLGIDENIFEAADIDGAGRFKKMLHISMPQLKYMMIIGVITSCGSIIRVDFSSIYFTVGANYNLYETVDVLETYMYRALISGQKFGEPVAMGVFQGVVGLGLSLLANYFIKKTDRNASLF